MAVERKLIREHKKRVMVREFLHKETERAGFGGAEIQRTPMGTRINLTVERPGFVIGRRGATIKKLTEDLHDRFGLDNPQVEVTEDQNPALNPQIMAMKLAEALERGWHFRRAGHSTLRRIMESGARGCLIKIGGKLTGGRSRLEKFVSGHIKYCGETALVHMNTGFAVAKKKLGVIGVTVAIMDASARLPDEIEVKSIEVATTTAAPAPLAPAAPGEAATKVPTPVPPAAAAVPQTEAPTAPEPEAQGGESPRRVLAGKFTDIEGVGQKKADALAAAGFESLNALEAASLDELSGVEGIGPKLAKKIKEELKRMRE